ncbi:hypothetical protein [Nocardioides sp. MH1]|uniref:hypothetical protein n=1 Tax=Nocardioides sp. MH1 TaxID=3242490 RepID=UPI003522B6C0
MRLPALLSLVAAGALLAAPAQGQAPGATGIERTERVVVRPATAAGRAAPGWTVHREQGPADCWGTSPTAVDDGITECGPSALYLPACWRSRRHTVLCLRQVTDDALVRVRYSGTYPDATAPARPSPQGLLLVNGQRCNIRVGGAWGVPPGHPDWVGYYACRHGDVYGPPNGDGINRHRPVWRVHLLLPDGTTVTRRVERATYVGTAR